MLVDDKDQSQIDGLLRFYTNNYQVVVKFSLSCNSKPQQERYTVVFYSYEHCDASTESGEYGVAIHTAARLLFSSKYIY